jgi:hypothetical protein
MAADDMNKPSRLDPDWDPNPGTRWAVKHPTLWGVISGVWFAYVIRHGRGSIVVPAITGAHSESSAGFS